MNRGIFFANVRQAANVIIFDGGVDETVSGRAWRQGVLQRPRSRFWGRMRRIIDRVFFWQPGHCEASHREDVLFARAILVMSETHPSE
jgi:hypothetical protein